MRKRHTLTHAQILAELERQALARLETRPCEICGAAFLPLQPRSTRCDQHRGANSEANWVSKSCKQCGRPFRDSIKYQRCKDCRQKPYPVGYYGGTFKEVREDGKEASATD
jgi:hypothetical protein